MPQQMAEIDLVTETNLVSSSCSIRATRRESEEKEP